MTQVSSARLLPQKPSRWAKILLNRKVPILLFFLLELAFLVISYLSLQEHFPSIILWEHLLSVFTFFYLLNRSMDSRSKLSWVIIIALFPIFGTALLYFSLAELGVRRLKKRLEDATVQASDYLSTCLLYTSFDRTPICADHHCYDCGDCLVCFGSSS